MSYVKKYPLLSPLETIERHDVLPSGSVHLGGLAMGKNPEDAKIEFIKRDTFLSVLRWSFLKLKTGPKYSCYQYDFPLKVLSWFPKALAEFQRPPSDGGLHAGAMISKDQDVDGEMLAVGSTTQGYVLKNRSRDARGINAHPDFYRPVTLEMSYEMLNRRGLLRLWKELGDKYDAGELQIISVSYIQEYPLLPPLETIERHDALPPSSVHLGGLAMGENPEDAKIEFIQRGAFLSILRWSMLKLKTGPKYSCHQYDFPLKALSWFPKALANFQRPPADGGLHAGAMISKDQNVDGEMLAVGSTTRGYNITNWSRDADGVDAQPEFYRPVTFSMSYEMLNDSGLLRLWKELGEKYDAGEL